MPQRTKAFLKAKFLMQFQVTVPQASLPLSASTVVAFSFIYFKFFTGENGTQPDLRTVKTKLRLMEAADVDAACSVSNLATGWKSELPFSLAWPSPLLI